MAIDIEQLGRLPQRDRVAVLSAYRPDELRQLAGFIDSAQGLGAAPPSPAAQKVSAEAKQIAAMHEQLKKRNGQIAERDAQISALMAKVNAGGNAAGQAAAAAALKAAQDKAAALAKTNAAMGEQLKKRNAQIEELRRATTAGAAGNAVDVQKAIAAAVAAKDKQIAAVQQQLGKRNAEVTTLRTQVAGQPAQAAATPVGSALATAAPAPTPGGYASIQPAHDPYAGYGYAPTSDVVPFDYSGMDINTQSRDLPDYSSGYSLFDSPSVAPEAIGYTDTGYGYGSGVDPWAADPGYAPAYDSWGSGYASSSDWDWGMQGMAQADGLGSWLSKAFKGVTGTKLSNAIGPIAGAVAGVIPGVGIALAPVVASVVGGIAKGQEAAKEQKRAMEAANAAAAAAGQAAPYAPAQVAAVAAVLDDPAKLKALQNQVAKRETEIRSLRQQIAAKGRTPTTPAAAPKAGDNIAGLQAYLPGLNAEVTALRVEAGQGSALATGSGGMAITPGMLAIGAVAAFLLLNKGKR